MMQILSDIFDNTPAILHIPWAISCVLWWVGVIAYVQTGMGATLDDLDFLFRWFVANFIGTLVLYIWSKVSD
jgi:hypothetical protein